MFHYVEDKEFLRRVRGVCGELMQDFCHTLKDAYDHRSEFLPCRQRRKESHRTERVGADRLGLQPRNRPLR